MTKTKELKPQRNSAIELLRIISMFMIVFHHFAVHGGFELTGISIPHFWYNLIVMGGKVGVDVFILISGYFLITNHRLIFNIKKIIKLWGGVAFYSIVLYVLLGIFGYADWSVNSIIKTFFPLTFSTWWFASAYLVLYLLHPFLNKLLQNLDKRAYQTLVVFLVIIWSIIPTLTTSSYQSNSLLWFIALYAIAGYIRLYGFNPKFSTKHYLILWLIFSILTYLSSVLLVFLGTKWDFFAEKRVYLYFYGQEKISTLLISLSLFMIFSSIKMKHHKWINVFASATFGVYLIHDYPAMRTLLWIDLFKNAQFQDSILLIPYSILIVFSVYFVATIIDLIRQKIVEAPFMILVNKYSESWLKPIKKLYNKVKNIVFGKNEID